MKKLTLIILLAITVTGFSQAWQNLLPQSKKENGTLTLHEYQKAFNTYWAQYNVDREGYYMKDGEKIKAAGWKQFNGGIYKSYDYEYNWINLSDGLEIAQIYRIGVSQLDPDLIIAGTHHNESKRLQNGNWW